MQATTTWVKNVNCLFANLNKNKMTAQHNLSNWPLTLVTENGFFFNTIATEMVCFMAVNSCRNVGYHVSTGYHNSY